MNRHRPAKQERKVISISPPLLVRNPPHLVPKPSSVLVIWNTGLSVPRPLLLLESVAPSPGELGMDQGGRARPMPRLANETLDHPELSSFPTFQMGVAPEKAKTSQQKNTTNTKLTTNRSSRFIAFLDVNNVKGTYSHTRTANFS